MKSAAVAGRCAGSLAMPGREDAVDARRQSGAGGAGRRHAVLDVGARLGRRVVGR